MRKKPFSAIGIRRKKCVRCGKPARHQWKVCADDRYRPVCDDCDLLLNAFVLKWLREKRWKRKIRAYRITQ